MQISSERIEFLKRPVSSQIRHRVTEIHQLTKPCSSRNLSIEQARHRDEWEGSEGITLTTYCEPREIIFPISLVRVVSVVASQAQRVVLCARVKASSQICQMQVELTTIPCRLVSSMMVHFKFWSPEVADISAATSRNSKLVGPPAPTALPYYHALSSHCREHLER